MKGRTKKEIVLLRRGQRRGAKREAKWIRVPSSGLTCKGEGNAKREAKLIRVTAGTPLVTLLRFEVFGRFFEV